VGDFVEKMIVGIILCVLGGAGFLTSIGGISMVLGTITGMPGMETVTAPELIINAIIFIVSIVLFALGIIVIQADREGAGEYGRY
jgi:hypothetical protein